MSISAIYVLLRLWKKLSLYIRMDSESQSDCSLKIPLRWPEETDLLAQY